MNIFDGIEKLITEHGSAAILNQQLSFAKEQFSALESKVEDLRTENADLKSELRREQADGKKAKDDLHQLQLEHAEDIRVHSGIEFRNGKRTGGQWLPFCPVCHTPADDSTGILRCAYEKCGWSILMPKSRIPEIVQKLSA